MYGPRAQILLILALRNHSEHLPYQYSLTPAAWLVKNSPGILRLLTALCMPPLTAWDEYEGHTQAETYAVPQVGGSTVHQDVDPIAVRRSVANTSASTHLLYWYRFSMLKSFSLIDISLAGHSMQGLGANTGGSTSKNAQKTYPRSSNSNSTQTSKE